MVALRSGTYTAVPISATREGVRRVDVDELYDVAQYRPKVRTWPASRCSCIESPVVLRRPHRRRRAQGSMPSYAASSGATVTHGIEIVGIRNGWDGLMEGDVQALERDARAWHPRTRRHDPRHSRQGSYVHGDGYASVRQDDRGERHRRHDRDRRRRHPQDGARALRRGPSRRRSAEDDRQRHSRH